MLRRFLIFLLLLIPAVSLADAAWINTPAEVSPGNAAFAFAFDGDTADIALMNTYGDVVASLSGFQSETGTGIFALEQLAPGSYVLRLTSGDSMAQCQFTVARPAILSVDAPEDLTDGWSALVETSTAGTLTLTAPDGTILTQSDAIAGVNTLRCAATLPAGVQMLQITLNCGGVESAPEPITIRVPAGTQPAHDLFYESPDDRSGVVCDHDVCYWKLNMGEMDEAAIWKVLTAPVTVLDGNERHQCKVRREPSSSCTDYVGEVTYASQAVHVLERGKDWTLIEAYSSSVEGSSVAVWARQFQGYVKTSLLKEVEVSQKYGLVIDKLQQRLYVFKDGALYSTLLCSTGYARNDTPFNESPAGEFLALSWTGGFWAGSLYCDMAIRINDGILLHEVPCTVAEQADGTKVRSYERCERYLGEKASHGCIRIQRNLTPERVNAKWLWDNLPRTGAKAKVIIWDEIGRVLGYPGDELPLYYNPNGGKNYHSSAYCVAVKEKYWPLTAFPYSELDNKPYASLTACPSCAPQLRREGIDTINQKNTRGN